MRTAAKAPVDTIRHPFTRREVTNLTAEMPREHFGAVQSVKWLRDDDKCVRLHQ